MAGWAGCEGKQGRKASTTARPGGEDQSGKVATATGHILATFRRQNQLGAYLECVRKGGVKDKLQNVSSL